MKIDRSRDCTAPPESRDCKAPPCSPPTASASGDCKAPPCSSSLRHRDGGGRGPRGGRSRAAYMADKGVEPDSATSAIQFLWLCRPAAGSSSPYLLVASASCPLIDGRLALDGAAVLCEWSEARFQATFGPELFLDAGESAIEVHLRPARPRTPHHDFAGEYGCYLERMA